MQLYPNETVFPVPHVCLRLELAAAGKWPEASAASQDDSRVPSAMLKVCPHLRHCKTCCEREPLQICPFNETKLVACLQVMFRTDSHAEMRFAVAAASLYTHENLDIQIFARPVMMCRHTHLNFSYFQSQK